MAEATATKTCSKCGEAKPLTMFNRRKTAADGRTSQCKACAVQYAQAWAARSSGAPKPLPFGEKACTGCGQVKPLTAFYVRRASTDGRAAKCAECGRRSVAAYRAANPDKVIEARRRWAANNPEYSAENARLWRERNPDAKREYDRGYALANREQVAARKRAWYEANQEQLAADRDPVRAAERQARHQMLRPGARRARQALRRARQRNNPAEVVDLESLWTGVCAICGQSIDRQVRWPDSLSRSIDHIVPISQGGGHVRDNLQWTHLICNIRKGARSA